MDHTTVDSEFLRPLVNGWLSKLESAGRGRAQWMSVAKECEMFYSHSAQAMWNPEYGKKFWKGVKLPRFRITISKAFEMVAIYGPNLFWEVPSRTVDTKRPRLEVPPELFASAFGQDPQVMQMYQQLNQQQDYDIHRNKLIGLLMTEWLNYTPREQPGGGLAGHSNRCVVDALIKGRGALASRPYQMPGSGRNLVGSFRVAPENIYLDPDFNSVDECRWMAIKHVDVCYEVEERFNLPKGSLKNKATLESSWQYSELSTDDQSPAHRKEGKTNDLCVWYEIFSKCGLGIKNTSVDSTIRDHMDSVVGQYAYIAVCGDVTYPLNMPTERIRSGATDEDVKRAFEWPVPCWADDSWPIELLDFYIDPASAWPVPPLAPGLGELKLLNFLVSWMTNRVWSSSRDFWAVAQPYIEHYKDYINNGEDQQIIPTPVGLKSPREAIEILSQPETRQDMSRLIEFVSDMFDRRVGLTAGAYGQNENNTQNRTAEETVAKSRAINVRPEYMQKQVVDWQSRVAAAEAFCTRWFVTGEDVKGLLGPMGAMMWDKLIVSSDVELVVRQFEYTVAAASIRRPNRDRDIGNYQQIMGQVAPVFAGYGQATGNYGPFNGMMSEWARLHDADVSKLEIPAPEPPTPEAQQAQQQMQQLQMAELDGKVKKLNADAENSMSQAQAKPVELQMQQTQAQMGMQMEQLRQQGEQAKQQFELAKLQSGLQAQQAENAAKVEMMQIELQIKQLEAQQAIEQDAVQFQQEVDQQQEMADTKLTIEVEKAMVQQEIAKTQADAQIEVMKKTSKAKKPKENEKDES